MTITTPTILRRSCPAQRANSMASLPSSRAFPAVMVSLAVLAMAGIASASLIAYEPFNYTAGSFANGTAATGTGLAGTWTCGAAGTVISGLTYTGLPVANNALSSPSRSRQYVSFSSALSTGTKHISFLFTQTGNNGGNWGGVYLLNGGTGLFYGYGLSPYSPSQGYPGLGSTTTTGTAVQAGIGLQTSTHLQNFNSTYLIVLRIDFNTSGANDTVTVYVNPAANASSPGVSADQSFSLFDVGTITGIGVNDQDGGFAVQVDEIRVGDTYGDVVGYVSKSPNAPTGLNATPGANLVLLSWTAAAGSPTGYSVKRSTASGGPYTTVGTTTAPIVTCSDSVLGGQTYYYVVTAVNDAGESANSSQVSASPTLAAPAAAAGPYTAIGTTTAPTVIYTDSSGLNNGTTYYYVVSATGPGGTSSDTSPVSATPVSHIAVLTLVRGAGITWFASNSVTYQVQWASALLGTNTVWNNLGSPVVGSGATNTVFDPVGPPHNYFQVLAIQ